MMSAPYSWYRYVASRVDRDCAVDSSMTFVGVGEVDFEDGGVVVGAPIDQEERALRWLGRYVGWENDDEVV